MAKSQICPHLIILNPRRASTKPNTINECFAPEHFRPVDMMYLNRDGKAFTTTTVEKALL